MPSFEQPTPLAEANRTEMLVDRIKQDPRLARLYEESADEEIPHGSYAGHAIIGKDMDVLDGVYMGAGRREAIVVSEDGGELHSKYQDVLKQVEAAFRQHGDAARGHVLRIVHESVKSILKYDDNGVKNVVHQAGAKSDGLIPLDAFIKAGVGVCRHQALLATYMLQRLQRDGFLSNQRKISVDRNTVKGVGGHAWTRYTNRAGQVIIIDPAQDYIGLLKDVPGDRWMYQRPEDKLAEPIDYEAFASELRALVTVSHTPVETLEDYVRKNVKRLPKDIVVMAQERAGTQDEIAALTIMMKRRMAADGVEIFAEQTVDPEKLYQQMIDRIAKAIRSRIPAQTAIELVVDDFLKTHDPEILGGVGNALTVIYDPASPPDQRGELITKLHSESPIIAAQNEVDHGRNPEPAQAYKPKKAGVIRWTPEPKHPPQPEQPAAAPQQPDEDLLAVDFNQMPDMRVKPEPEQPAQPAPVKKGLWEKFRGFFGG